MQEQRVGYIRVSTLTNKTSRQLEGMELERNSERNWMSVAIPLCWPVSLSVEDSKSDSLRGEESTPPSSVLATPLYRSSSARLEYTEDVMYQ